ncbi:MAG: peptide ABC transporter substrate-binding protein [Fusobacteriaceae bacterium]
MKKSLNFIFFLLSIIFILASCGEKKEVGLIKTVQKMSYNLGADPKTLDPHLNSSVDGSIVIGNAFEGLFYIDNDSKTIPAAAESVNISDDGTVYTFFLRKNAKWSDGKPVTAHDFMYSWIRGLKPETAMEYVYQLFYIKNSESFYNGTSKIEDLGIKIIDDYTIELTLEQATPYFLSLAAFPAYFPLREDIVEKDSAWATKVETYIGNGPFKIKSWSPKENIVFMKNENYWDSANVKLEELRFDQIVDEKTSLGAFQTGEFDIGENPPISEIETLLNSGVAKQYPYLGTYFYAFNITGNTSPEVAKFLGDKRVRKALSLAIDRKTLVEKVTKGGQLPALSFVPKGIITTDEKEFSTKSYFSDSPQIDEAQKLLAEAGYSDPSSLPIIKFTYNTNDSHSIIAQAIQDMWKKNLGLNIELKNEEWAVFQTSRNEKNYEIARHGWIADYNDPMTFLDLWVTSSGNNDAGFSNLDYDKLIKEAQKEQNPENRTTLLHQAEDILMDEMPIIPLYYYTNIVYSNPKAKGWVKSPLGDVSFKNAYMED